jgi:TIR domain/FHA domain
MTTIFISHSSRDDEFVNQLVTNLHQHQFKTWVDHMDTPEGMLWANIIQDGLEKGEYMILVVTESSMQSRHVRIEWQSFQGLVKPMILLVLDEEVEIPRLLQDYPTVNWATTQEIDETLNGLLKYLPLPSTSSPEQAQSDPQIPQTRQLNPNAVGLNELQRLAGEIDSHTEPVVGESDIKLIIPKSDVSISYHVNHPMRVGRGSPHDIEKPDIDLNPYESIKTVSRSHAIISIKDGHLTLTDTGSSNGTFVDGKRLKPNVPAKIKSGTMVRFGALIVQIMQGT